MGALFTSSGSLLDTYGEVVDAIVEALHTVNSNRWFKQLKLDECDRIRAEHKNVLKRLQDGQRQFAKLMSKHLLDPHNRLFDEEGRLKVREDAGASIHGFLLGLIFEGRILRVSSALSVFCS
jgi:hypothetical protein